MLTPAITLTVCWAAGLERLTQPLVLSVLLISAGTGAATLYETGGAGFAWAGFACFTFSALLEALRVVYIQLLLGRFKFNTLEVPSQRGVPAAAVRPLGVQHAPSLHPA